MDNILSPMDRGTIVFLDERIFFLIKKSLLNVGPCAINNTCVCVYVYLVRFCTYTYTHTYIRGLARERARERESFISTAGTSSSGVGA